MRDNNKYDDNKPNNNHCWISFRTSKQFPLLDSKHATQKVYSVFISGIGINKAYAAYSILCDGKNSINQNPAKSRIFL